MSSETVSRFEELDAGRALGDLSPTRWRMGSTCTGRCYGPNDRLRPFGYGIGTKPY